MQPSQNYLVYQHDGVVVARGEIHTTIQHQHSDATQVIEWVLTQLETQGGGTVRLQPGRYELTHSLRIGTRVTLLGSGPATIMSGSADFTGEALLHLHHSSRSTIRDLELHGEGSACAVGLKLEGAVDCNANAIVAQGFSQNGFLLTEHCGCCTLENCRAADNAIANFSTSNQQSKGRMGDFVPNLFLGCIAVGGGHGFELHRTTVFNVIACMAFQPHGHGFFIHHTSNSVLVSGCRSFQCELSAVYVEDAHELNVSSNIFCWQREDGIVLNNVNWAAISGNEIIDSGVRHRQGEKRIGVLLKNGTKGVQLSGNTIFNWGDQPPMSRGILETAECSENILANNHINYAIGGAVESHGLRSLAKDNLASEKEAYRNMTKPAFPDYKRDVLTAYLSQMRAASPRAK